MRERFCLEAVVKEGGKWVVKSSHVFSEGKCGTCGASESKHLRFVELNTPRTCPKCNKEMLVGERTAHKECGFCDTVKCWKIDDQQPEGMFAYLVGYKYPYKGVPQDRVLQNTAIFKRSLVATGILLLSKPIVYLLPFFLFLPRKKTMRKLVEWAASISRTAYTQHADTRKMCRSVRELVRVFTPLVKELRGEEERDMKDLVLSLSYVLEVDNAYRYRMQDVLGNLDKEALRKDAKKEILRLMNLGLQRERAIYSPEQRKTITAPDLATKWRSMSYAVKAIALFYPSFMVRMAELLLEMDVEEIKMDEGDWYYACERWDYEFGGLSYEERLRLKLREDEDWEKPSEDVAVSQANVALIPNPEFMLVTEQQARETLEKLCNNFMTDFLKRKQASVQPQASVASEGKAVQS